MMFDQSSVAAQIYKKIFIDPMNTRSFPCVYWWSQFFTEPIFTGYVFRQTV